jgi:hypothetical protein
MTTENDVQLLESLKAEAERLAEREGTTLSNLVNIALAEKLSALRTADFFKERARRANLPEALALLEAFGSDEAPREGDELEPDQLPGNRGA